MGSGKRVARNERALFETGIAEPKKMDAFFCCAGHEQEHATAADHEEIEPAKLQFVETLGTWKIATDVTNLR